ncbi:MAG: DUF262 domain-containing protein, partial [Lachnospiraceae bacterium]|nr:DUF262 domain-containing protein [Lachnospiraceae bacterium]
MDKTIQRNDFAGIKNLQQFIEIASSNGMKFTVPNLQRDYVWGKEEWRKLWDDIINVLNKMECSACQDEHPQHFTGVITLQKKQDTTELIYDVLDGQQRLTTLSVLLDYLLYFTKNKPKESSLSFFDSRLTFVQDPEYTDGKSKDKYLEIYSFFMDCHLEIQYQKVDQLIDIVKNRLFFMVHVARDEEDSHSIFEGLNATGKNLEFSELILNSLLEEKAQEENSCCIKKSWEDLLGIICGTQSVKFENENGEEIEEEIVESKPLKLKKFFNALNAMTLGENVPIQESVADFNCMVSRLCQFGELGNQTEKSSVSEKINMLTTWAEIYSIVTEPAKNFCKIEDKSYAKELYYLSIWNTTTYIPVVMRIVYRNLKLSEAGWYKDNKVNDTGYYSELVVKNLLKTILATIVNTRIILNRLHSDDKNTENKIKIIDFILDAAKKSTFLCCCEFNNDEIKIAKRKYGDDYINKIGIRFGEKLSDIMSVLGDDAIIRLNDAEVMIRAYQYTSAGSKFLLTLYADKDNLNGKNPSRICELESRNGKSQVEHMVAQNLSNGSFGDYGFDVNSIGLLDNLILLSSSTNQSIGDEIPEEKLSCWQKDVFGELFISEEFKITDNVKKELKHTQEGKVNSIVEAFKSYFDEFDLTSVVEKLTCTFASKKIQNGRTVQLCWDADSELKNGNESEHVLRINAGTYEQHPKKIDNIGVNYFIKTNGKVIQHGGAYIYSILESFLEKIDEINNFHQWLSECENSIKKEDITNGSNEVTTKNGNTFTYSQKMIHTGAFHNSQNINAVMGRAGINKYEEKVINDDKKIILCNDFSIHIIISELKKIYENYDANTKKKFGFWIQLTQKAPVFIEHDGKRKLVQTEYINVGDSDIYSGWIKKHNDYKGIFQNQEDSSPSIERGKTDKGNVNSYFTYEQKSLCDILELSNIRIPEYQRAYVWDEENWEALYNSMIKNQENPLFLGTIVFRKEQEGGNEVFYLVDGQQRLTTLVAFLQNSTEDLVPEELGNNIPKGLANFAKTKDDLSMDISNNVIFDVIYISGPREYQYEVFSSINSAGKKLTVEEKIANHLFSKYSN